MKRGIFTSPSDLTERALKAELKEVKAAIKEIESYQSHHQTLGGTDSKHDQLLSLIHAYESPSLSSKRLWELIELKGELQALQSEREFRRQAFEYAWRVLNVDENGSSDSLTLEDLDCIARLFGQNPALPEFARINPELQRLRERRNAIMRVLRLRSRVKPVARSSWILLVSAVGASAAQYIKENIEKAISAIIQNVTPNKVRRIEPAGAAA